MKRIGYLGVCANEYCGSIEGYFCVRCRHYCMDCRCGFNFMDCACHDDKFWASEGERKMMQEELKKLSEV